MTSKALKEITNSDPYFILLSSKKTNQTLRRCLLEHAPADFFSVLSQIVRHLLNGTFCSKNPNFCTNHENSLYLLALPSTTNKDKRKILLAESPAFISELHLSLKTELSK